MACREGGFVSCLRAAAAVSIAHARYWLTVSWRVRQQLHRWTLHARAIGDPVLRWHAVSKLRDERANTEAIATLCTLAPRRYRRPAVEAAVALQVMYDYLDTLTERPETNPFRDGRQLFCAFSVALTPGKEPVDYYRHHPRQDDDGYLDALVAEARRSLAELPAVAAVLPVARATAARFAEAQIRSHAVEHVGSVQLETWATEAGLVEDLTWWEWAGGAAASVLGLHALVAAAADPRTTRAQALRIDQAYLLTSTLTTMLDSLVDGERDAATDAHSYISYYPTVDDASRRIAAVACWAATAARRLPNPEHHAMTVAGVAAFYLSRPDAWRGSAEVVTPCVIRELRPIVLPILAGFVLGRWLTQFGLHPPGIGSRTG